MIQAICSSVRKVATVQMKLNFLPSRIGYAADQTAPSGSVMTIADSNRDEIVIAATVHGKMREGPNGGGLSRKAILSEIDKSLKRQVRREHYAVAFKALGRRGGCEWFSSSKGLYPAQVN